MAGRRVTVVGLGRSGVAACRLLRAAGAVVTASDRSPAEALGVDLQALRRLGVRLETGGHRPETILGAELLVVSPGVDLRMPLLAKAREAGIPMLSEVELAYRSCQARFLGITGTNGKSTTTTLVGLMLERAGVPVVVAGNIGTALCDVVPGLGPDRWVVAELSSFQLETIEMFRAEVACLLNVTQNHLDRYADLAEYRDAKARLFLNQEPGDWAVLNADDPLVLEAAVSARARRALFSRTHPVEEGAFLEGDRLLLRRAGETREVCRVQDIRIRGVHNLENALAAAVAATLAGASGGAARAVLAEFPGLEHRLEPVAVLGGVQYVNDSKGTSVGAVVRSLESFPARVILIAGGRDKGSDFIPLRAAVEGRVRALVLIGEAREKIAKALAGTAPVHTAGSMEEAVRRAAGLAGPGDVVLLSPACASFDMFRDFEDRGRAFKAAVQGLAGGR
ncbi:MAG: UDP-N-acetylmuramoyl-L-alanine--D-glutamate ligase [candidate division NC10 bacterium]|nr:UDP-N-acetylmuramoyl-L-alanine--D-glutamate ligase [candidate division NC10 bacterium]